MKEWKVVLVRRTRYLFHQPQMWDPVMKPLHGMLAVEVGEAYFDSPG